MRKLALISIALLSLVVSACTAGSDLNPVERNRQTPDPEPNGDGDGDGEGNDDPMQNEKPIDDGVPSVGMLAPELLRDLAGLWSGQASMTPLGDFPMLTIDLRAANEPVLFGSVDLDTTTVFRWAFFVETYSGTDVLIFRNRGEFMGQVQDTRLTIVERSANSYHFCAIGAGCGYVEVTFTFTSPSSLVVDTKVRGRDHLLWAINRIETRPAVESPTSLGSGTAPLPTLPTLATTVSWQAPLTAPADVWILLYSQPCSFPMACAPSRSIRKTVTADSMSTAIDLLHVHSGVYFVTALLDRNQNLIPTNYPDTGDGASIPNQQHTVSPSGTNQAQLSIVFDF